MPIIIFEGLTPPSLFVLSFELKSALLVIFHTILFFFLSFKQVSINLIEQADFDLKPTTDRLFTPPSLSLCRPAGTFFICTSCRRVKTRRQYVSFRAELLFSYVFFFEGLTPPSLSLCRPKGLFGLRAGSGEPKGLFFRIFRGAYATIAMIVSP